GIALVLSSVFIPAGFILGITGSLYRQFALTIAFSVLLSMVNALTYKPAQCALILRPRAKDAARGLLGRFFAAFDRVFTSAQEGYVRGSHALIRKAGLSLLVLAAFAAFAVGLGKILPRSFMPQEDQGYFLVNVQLPEAASLQRTNAVMRKVDAILKEQPGVHYINSVSGFSILSQTSSPRSGLAFVQLAPYDERATPALQADAVVAALNAKLGALPDAQAVALLPPAIPGVGQAGGVDFFIQDRAGNSLDYLWQNAQRFMAELRNRPLLCAQCERRHGAALDARRPPEVVGSRVRDAVQRVSRRRDLRRAGAGLQHGAGDGRGRRGRGPGPAARHGVRLERHELPG